MPGRHKVEDPKSRKVTVRFTATEFERLNDRAAKEGLTISKIVRKIILSEVGSDK